MSLLIHFRSVFFSIVTGVILLLFATNVIVPTTRVGVALMVVIVIATIYIAERVGHRFVFVFAPLSTALMAVALLYFIDPLGARIFFAFAAMTIYYVALLGIVRMRNNMRDITARSLFSISLITALFFFYAVTYGVYINFAIPLWVFLCTQFLFVLSVSFVSLYTYSTHVRRVFLYSFAIAFAMMQFGWMVNFWPFGYLTNAAISLMFYYVLWDMALMTFMETLSKQHTVTTIAVVVTILLLILFTSQWVLI